VIHNDFNARSDIFTLRAPFEGAEEFRFVGMSHLGCWLSWRQSRLRLDIAMDRRHDE
jgi:hypothetical protein